MGKEKKKQLVLLLQITEVMLQEEGNKDYQINNHQSMTSVFFVLLFLYTEAEERDFIEVDYQMKIRQIRLTA